jgi:hypothetical protein
MDDELVAAILAGVAQDRFGLAPYDPRKNVPRDIGLGGPSTEFLATEYDPSGQVMNYPSIWWDKQGNPHLLEPDAAYQQALDYEQTALKSFPRFPNIGAAEFAAENRSAMGGGDVGPLATRFGDRRMDIARHLTKGK